MPINAQRTTPTIWNKNPKPFKKKVFMIVEYEGEKVSAYKHYIKTVNTVFGAGSGIIQQIQESGYVYYYLINGEDIAKAYFMSPAWVGKSWLKLIFNKYPGMKEQIKTYDVDKLYDDPIDIIKKLESVL